MNWVANDHRVEHLLPPTDRQLKNLHLRCSSSSSSLSRFFLLSLSPSYLWIGSGAIIRGPVICEWREKYVLTGFLERFIFDLLNICVVNEFHAELFATIHVSWWWSLGMLNFPFSGRAIRKERLQLVLYCYAVSLWFPGVNNKAPHLLPLSEEISLIPLRSTTAIHHHKSESFYIILCDLIFFPLHISVIS